MTDSTTETKRPRGMPRGRRKGYTQSSTRPESTPAETRLHGIVGRVKDLYGLIDERLKELDWNWVTLADQIPCSRQYVVDLASKKDQIPADFFFRVCQVLGIQASTHILTTEDE